MSELWVTAGYTGWKTILREEVPYTYHSLFFTTLFCLLFDENCVFHGTGIGIATKIKPDDMYVSHFRKRMSCIIIVWRGRETRWLARSRRFYLPLKLCLGSFSNFLLPMGIRVLENELCKVVLAASGFRLANFSPNTRYLLFREDSPADEIGTNSERVLSYSNVPMRVTLRVAVVSQTNSHRQHSWIFKDGWFTSGISLRRSS